jgi:ABC-type arginine transport system ATPase subunit
MSTHEPAGEKRDQQEDPAPAKMLELLERLGAAERLVDAPIAMGLSQEDARAIFAKAAEIVRESLRNASPKRRWPVRGSLLDWQEMTIAEALEILANPAGKPNTEET